jgi:hypothetical protein
MKDLMKFFYNPHVMPLGIGTMNIMKKILN